MKKLKQTLPMLNATYRMAKEKEMKIEKLPPRSGYMPLPLVNSKPNGFGYWHLEYMWYCSSSGTYVRRGYGADGEWI
ncbi:MAG: hypothetical protein MN733_00675 [Nitrososphaera sp.]|nr:hypothetical protein [Nitrososphaera sp.]